MNATRSQLVAQYNRAKKLLWTEHFREAANTHTPDLFDTADLMAIGSRETNLDPKWLTRKGDNGHGAGLMQIDDRSFPEFTNSTKWKDARLGIMYGAKVLRQKWDDLQKNAGKSILFKNRYPFVGPKVSGRLAQQIAIAAYNSGRAAPYHYSKGRDPDYGTTGKDYSSDVMARARVFRDLLGKDGMLDSAADDPATPAPNPATTTFEHATNNPALPTEAPLPIESGGPVVEQKTLQEGDGGQIVTTQAAEGTNPHTDEAAQVSQGGRMSTMLASLGGLGGVATAIGGFISANTNLIAVGIVCLTVVILALIFRKAIMDAIRMQTAADPSKYNVK